MTTATPDGHVIPELIDSHIERTRKRLWHKRTDGTFVKVPDAVQPWDPRPGHTLGIETLGMGVESSMMAAVALDTLISGPTSGVHEALPSELAEKVRRLSDVMLDGGRDASSLIFLTSMTGSEWPLTKVMMEDHLLPLMRQAGTRYIQAARHGMRVSDGLTVLDDSTRSRQLFFDGDYTLFQEMRENGTVPQGSANARRCSIKSKGEVLDPLIELITEGRAYDHMIGFNAQETNRAFKDLSYEKPGRSSTHPLIAADISRREASEYLTRRFGVLWPKSACIMCPFAVKMGNEDNQYIFDAFKENPFHAVETLMTEFASLCLNPRQALLNKRSLLSVFQNSPGFEGILQSFEATKASTTFRIYELARVKIGKEPAARSLIVVDDNAASFEEMTARLIDMVGRDAVEIDATTARSHMAQRRPGTTDSIDHMYVVAPSWIAQKVNDQFLGKWDRASTTAYQGRIVRVHQDPLITLGAL